MTLAEWSKIAHELPTHPTTECRAVSVVINHLSPYRKLLWGLSDYRVSSVGGVVVWLVPKQENAQ